MQPCSLHKRWFICSSEQGIGHIVKLVSFCTTEVYSFFCICCCYEKMNTKEIAIRYFRHLKGMLLQLTLQSRIFGKLIATKLVKFSTLYRIQMVSGLLVKNFHALYVTYYTHFIPDLITHNNIFQRVQFIKLFIMYFSLFCYYFLSFLGPNILLSLFSNIFCLCSSLMMRNQAHTYTMQWVI